MKRFRQWLIRFFFPPPGTPPWLRALPYLVLGALTLIVIISGAYAWDYTNSPSFCGTSCHTMPPEYTAYLVSPHARIACVECHIGRGFIATQITRKAGDLKHVAYTLFRKYEFPITADELRPARETCEKCHFPEKFSDDSLREIKHYGEDKNNTPASTYLILKTGGGVKRLGLGRGIHWHIENRILYYPSDKEEQTIPYVRVYNDDGSIDEYVDLTSGFDRSALDETQLKEMDCITCHNRITHLVYPPEVSLNIALTRGVINATIPEIRLKGVEVLRASYASQDQAINGIAGLEGYYKTYYSEYYAANQSTIQQAITNLQDIYTQSVFLEQKSDWNTHPNNIGHKDSPGCFRCHDGKHLSAEQQAVRLECNLCHSIPVVAGTQDFVADIEISRGPEPQTHLNTNWITLHREVLDETCANCHNTANPGGADNTSFCSNSACHGSVWSYAGFDAPALRTVLLAQLPPTPTPQPLPAGGALTFEATIGPLFRTRCGSCHGESGVVALNLTTFATALAGSTNGPAIFPGDAETSPLVKKQSGEQPHFGQFSPDELTLVVQWIAAGAPEK